MKIYDCSTYSLATGTVTNIVLCNCTPKLLLLCLNKLMILYWKFIILKNWNTCCKFIILINYQTLNMPIIHLVHGIMWIILGPCSLIHSCNTILFLLSLIFSDAMLLPSFNVLSSCMYLGSTGRILRILSSFIS